MEIRLPPIPDMEERPLLATHDRKFTMKHTDMDFSLELKHNYKKTTGLNREHAIDGVKRCRFSVNTCSIVGIEVDVKHL